MEFKKSFFQKPIFSRFPQTEFTDLDNLEGEPRSIPQPAKKGSSVGSLAVRRSSITASKRTRSRSRKFRSKRQKLSLLQSVKMQNPRDEIVYFDLKLMRNLVIPVQAQADFMSFAFPLCGISMDRAFNIDFVGLIANYQFWCPISIKLTWPVPACPIAQQFYTPPFQLWFGDATLRQTPLASEMDSHAVCCPQTGHPLTIKTRQFAEQTRYDSGIDYAANSPNIWGFVKGSCPFTLLNNASNFQFKMEIKCYAWAPR